MKIQLLLTHVSFFRRSGGAAFVGTSPTQPIVFIADQRSIDNTGGQTKLPVGKPDLDPSQTCLCRTFVLKAAYGKK